MCVQILLISTDVVGRAAVNLSTELMTLKESIVLITDMQLSKNRAHKKRIEASKEARHKEFNIVRV